MIRNEKGSVLSVAIIMIALLSFSLTSLTAYTYRTAENTNRVTEENSRDSEGKRLVNEAVARLKSTINTNIETEGIEWFKAMTTESTAYDDFKNDGEDGIKAIEDSLTDEDGSGITITESDADGEQVFLPDGVHQIGFRVAFPLRDGREVIRNVYFTDQGVEYENFNAFDYTMGSSESVALNGGNYVDSATIYGERMYRGYSTAYKNSDGDYQVVNAGDFNLAAGEEDVTPNRYECPDTSTCLDTPERLDGGLVLDESSYEYTDLSDTFEYFEDLFMDFKYDDHFFDRYASALGVEEGLIDDENYDHDEWLSDLATTDGTISQTDDFQMSEDLLIEGDATLDLNGNALSLNDHSLIVLGDLTIDSVDAINRPGEVFVFGDIHVNNDRDLMVSANLYSYGKIVIDFDQSHGFIADGDLGMSLYAKGNMLFERNSMDATPVSAFLFSEGSIKFDSAVAPTNFRGSVFAQGKEGLSDVFVERDGVDEPFKGILVNSYSGEIDPDTGDSVPDGLSGLDEYEDYKDAGTDEVGDLIIYEGSVYERTKVKGKGTPNPNSSHWTEKPDSFQGDSGNDHSFEFGALDSGDTGDETASSTSDPDYTPLGTNPSRPAVRTLNHTADTSSGADPAPVQSLSATPETMATENGDDGVFYNLPTFERLVITPTEDGEILSRSSTFIYE